MFFLRFQGEGPTKHFKLQIHITKNQINIPKTLNNNYSNNNKILSTNVQHVVLT